MMSLKSAWLTAWPTSDLFTLSLESKMPENENLRIRVRDLEFPGKPTKKNPLRHTIVIGVMDLDDLRLLRDVIDRFLEAE